MATQTHSPFETLARVIEYLDDDARSVRRTEATGSGGDGSLRATVDVSVGAASGGDSGLEPTDATVDDDLSVTFCAPSFPDPHEVLPAEYPRVSATPTDVWLDGESVVVTLTVTIGDADHPSDGVDATGTGESAGSTEDGDHADAAAGGTATAAFGSGSTNVAAGTAVRSRADRDEGRPETVTEAGKSSTEAGAFGSAAGGTDEPVPAADDAGSEAVSPLAAVRDESVPPYDDTPYLRRLYETCETFTEMSERIEMDVSAETVRRYMIEAEVHSPTTYETTGGERASSGERSADGVDESETDAASAAGDRSTNENGGSADSADTEGAADPAESAGRDRATADGGPDTAASLPDEQLVADGIGLPEELTLHEVVDVVVDARTVHEVQREVGLDYDRTRQLLDQLNVLDLVVGRVSTGSDRTVTVDLVADRIRQCAPDAT